MAGVQPKIMLSGGISGEDRKLFSVPSADKGISRLSINFAIASAFFQPNVRVN
jgi:hypothetical protein